MKNWIAGATMAVALIGFGSQASATVLAPGDTSVAPGIFSNVGWTLVTSNVGQVISSPTFTATASAWVYSDTNNTFCVGCLDFVYQVTRTGGADPIERITGGSFTGFSTNVGYVGTSSGTIPTNLDRSSSGSVIGFNFNGTDALTDSQSSRVLVVQTNATTWTAGFMAAIDNQAANGVAFQPSAVPEPMTFSLLGVGLVGLGLLRKRLS